MTTIVGARRTEAQVVAGLSGAFDPAAEAARAGNDCERFFYEQTDRVTNKWHHYLAVYDRHLSRFRGTGVRLIEVGIHNGGSLQMWRQYLGPDAVIHGLDLDPRCAAIDDPDLTIHIGSQDDPALLDSAVAAMGGVDVVIDDGSHLWRHQIATFEALYPRLAADGVYICEDTHTSYWPGFGEGRPRAESFVDYGRTLVDKLHGWYALGDVDPADLAFARQTRSVSFYDSMVVIEREERPAPTNRTVGRRRVV